MAVNTGTHDFAGTTACCRCGATIEAIADNFVSASCSNAINPKLIERIARAMCKADGNDPDGMCIHRYELERLSGLAANAKCAPPAGWLRPAWTLYASAAETAIIELEAAAMEPLPELRVWTAEADANVAEDVPVERTPWFPPHLFRVDREEVVMKPSTLQRPLTVTWSEHCDPTDWSGKDCGCKIEDPSLIADALAAQDAIDKEAAEIFAPASKDAPLIEAIRKQREKDGF